jgi:hypothetical protein
MWVVGGLLRPLSGLLALTVPPLAFERMTRQKE